MKLEPILWQRLSRKTREESSPMRSTACPSIKKLDRALLRSTLQATRNQRLRQRALALQMEMPNHDADPGSSVLSDRT